MLFTAPELDERESAVLAEIDKLRESLRLQLREPRRWTGSLRRMMFARNIRGSNSIEGFDAQLDDADAVALGEEPLDASSETKLALEGYRNAMTYVLQLAQEPDRPLSIDLIKSLHFMMTQYDLKTSPGRWRPGAIYVRDEQSGTIVHEGADVDEIPTLMDELVAQVNDKRETPALIRAAMAHLNLVMIHPFRDGNGKMSRSIQSLVLARYGVASPVFMSVEEYLGRNTDAYYAVLAEVGGGSWQPSRDTRPWIRFMLTAHLRQAQTQRMRIREAERMWVELEHLQEEHGLPERVLAGALFDAALGYRIRNATYTAAVAQSGEEISEQTATRDLARMVDAGLLDAQGKARARYYIAGARLKAIRHAVVAARRNEPSVDPFAE